MSTMRFVPDGEKVATVTSDVTLFRPTPLVTEEVMFFIALGILPAEQAVAEGYLESLTLPAGSMGAVVEECAEGCGHYEATGEPCGYAVRIVESPVSAFVGETIVLQSEQVSIVKSEDADWSLTDDDAVAAFLRAWDEKADGGEADYLD